MMKLFYSFILLLLSVSPSWAMEYINGEPQGGGAAIGSYEDVVALWTDCGSLFMKGDGSCSAGSVVESDPVYSAWDKSTGISITTSQITDITTYLSYADITALWTDCVAGVLQADGSCVVLGSAANSDITAFEPAGAAAAVIAASITESDTTHCPDGASVFTALAGKLTAATSTDVSALWVDLTCASGGLLYTDGTCVSLDSFTEVDPTVDTSAKIVAIIGAGVYQAPLTGGTDYLRPTTDVDDTPVDSETAQPVSSNWAYDHAVKATHLYHQTANVNPDALYANEAGIFVLDPKTTGALTVTEIYVALNEDPTNELTVTCYHKTAAIGYTGGTQIDTNDTAVGTFTANSAFDDVTIPAGSKIWCVIGNDPDATTVSLELSITATWD